MNVSGKEVQGLPGPDIGKELEQEQVAGAMTFDAFMKALLDGVSGVYLSDTVAYVSETGQPVHQVIHTHSDPKFRNSQAGLWLRWNCG